ncbi:hypothetical protein SAMN03159448_05574 [Sinorhizobium sp. NFACC03]|nr:hypothetical protein SAMN03159448_05574 [Sinorhizobium sp. NFACC03]
MPLSITNNEPQVWHVLTKRLYRIGVSERKAAMLIGLNCRSQYFDCVFGRSELEQLPRTKKHRDHENQYRRLHCQ